jgi:hypothetical protein
VRLTIVPFALSMLSELDELFCNLDGEESKTCERWRERESEFGLRIPSSRVTGLTYIKWNCGEYRTNIRIILCREYPSFVLDVSPDSHFP